MFLGNVNKSVRTSLPPQSTRRSTAQNYMCELSDALQKRNPCRKSSLWQWILFLLLNLVRPKFAMHLSAFELGSCNFLYVTASQSLWEFSWICKWNNHCEVRHIWGGRICKIDACWLVQLTITDLCNCVVLYTLHSVLHSSLSRYIFIWRVVHSDIFSCLGLLGGLLLLLNPWLIVELWPA